ncbi:hypothetical protein [Clostridium butyricum]|nr:hypothetical protein [Clostridium butyricum]NFB72962.1 hypothetical protein [Clostridium butyricum]UTY52645.1 hypothetical protein HNS01_05930 [Clostridium butyricum]BBK76186.1 hypothetical protein Cbu04g_11940 [Clostridium butyricum]GEQ25665.1 hypothetical protein CBU03nite_20880 [Clostridium butyricum]
MKRNLIKTISLFTILMSVGTSSFAADIDMNDPAFNSSLYENTSTEEAVYHDDVIESTPELPKDGDGSKLKIGFTSTDYGLVYCQDEKLLKVTGWQQINGYWYHFTNYIIDTGWFNDNGTLYFLQSNGSTNDGYGRMKTGWYKDSNGTWYYLTSSGAMATGWHQINNNWYYFDSNGKMAHDTYINNYYLNCNGVWIN